MADDQAECPHCGAVSHYQKRGFRSGARKKFIIFFIGLVVFCGFFIYWLPR
ncbi:MAG: protein nirD [Candidatus Thiodiazotropha weberae]|nr:protein nirD [Candidatus Thiodiazotropha lotti]